MKKNCTRCLENLPFLEFYKDKEKKDGLTSHCKKCCSEENKLRNKNNVEARHKTNAEYRKTERAKENSRASAARRRMIPEILEKMKKATQIWTRRNPDKIAVYNARHRAKHLDAYGEGLTKDKIKEIKESYSNRCAYCGKQGKLEIDHIVPLSNNGRNSIENSVPACRSCNASKNKNSLLYFLYQRISNVK